MTIWEFLDKIFTYFISGGLIASIIGIVLIIFNIVWIIKNRKYVKDFIFQKLKIKQNKVDIVKSAEFFKCSNYAELKNFEILFGDFLLSIADSINKQFLDIVMDEFENNYEILLTECDKMFCKFTDIKFDDLVSTCTEEDEGEIQKIVDNSKAIVNKTKNYYHQYISNVKIEIIAKTKRLIKEDYYWEKDDLDFEKYLSSRIPIFIQFLKEQEKTNIYSSDELYISLIKDYRIKEKLEQLLKESFMSSRKKANDFIEELNQRMLSFEQKNEPNFGLEFLSDWGLKEKILNRIGK